MSEMIVEIWSTPETNIGTNGRVIDDAQVRRLTVDEYGEIPVRDMRTPPPQKTVNIKAADVSMQDHRLIVEGVPYRIVFTHASPKKEEEPAHELTKETTPNNNH